ncbi:MAG TPA: ClpXP protease specificity-enhancing factor [Gammaproteobacteria bacterium]|nr:ClpXP protease specificity-enhancing factor [Gammaproteobacteria bacterium]
MTSSKPYLIRALYEWILDNGATPHILVDATGDQLIIPPGIASDGKVVLNLSPQAVENLEMANDHVSFSARFNGVAEEIYCPIGSLMAIYARESGEGMMFPPEEDVPAKAGDTGVDDKDKPKGPTLKIIK